MKTKDRPILFSAPMVRALLDGSKTQTRRALNTHALKLLDAAAKLGECNHLGAIEPTPEGDTDFYIQFCPYGHPGDRLWVRETFADLQGTGVEHRPISSGPLQRYAFAADTKPGSYGDEARKEFGVKWKPSIFMPRTASRILLEITGVRVERLQYITRGDAMSEGCPFPNMAQGDNPRQWYQQLWDQINGPDSWAANPWVWVIEFKKADQ